MNKKTKHGPRYGPGYRPGYEEYEILAEYGMTKMTGEEEPAPIAHGKWERGIDAAVAEMRRVIETDEFPHRIAIRDLDIDALEILAGAAVCAWHCTRLDGACETQELENLLPKLAEMPIDWGTPMGQWSRARSSSCCAA